MESHMAKYFLESSSWYLNTDEFLGSQNRPEPERASSCLVPQAPEGHLLRLRLWHKVRKKHLEVLIFNAVTGKRILAEGLNLVDYAKKD